MNSSITRIRRRLLVRRPGLAAMPACTVFAALLAAACPMHAQEVKDLTLKGVPPDLIQANTAPSAPFTASGAAPAAVDLGQNMGTPGAAGAPGVAGSASMPADGPGAAARAAAAAVKAAQAPSSASGRRVGAVRRASRGGGDIERAVFDRAPIQVPLALNVERLVTLPAPVALHVPRDIETVARIESIDRTLYITALVPFAPIRIVAELIDSGQQVPLDIVAGKDTAASTAELEISTVDGKGAGSSASAAASSVAKRSGDEPGAAEAGADMVMLTRHAARQLYAPRRLAVATLGVVQVGVSDKPVVGLLRGANAETVPLGQWKSGQLYVTAVRVTNLSRYPLEIPLEQLRGRWISATAQHGRIGPAGSETDTTAIYLVCDRSFEACL
ncbi:MAG: TIGR03749 family integrating conjugative element protein [Gammaproteobacteria bacterium]